MTGLNIFIEKSPVPRALFLTILAIDMMLYC